MTTLRLNQYTDESRGGVPERSHVEAHDEWQATHIAMKMMTAEKQQKVRYNCTDWQFVKLQSATAKKMPSVKGS